MVPPFLLRNMIKEKRSETKNELHLINENNNLKTENDNLKTELKFYKSIFNTHNNSAVYNLYVKTINGVNVWADPIRDTLEYLYSLDKDKQVIEWLEPIKFER